MAKDFPCLMFTYGNMYMSAKVKREFVFGPSVHVDYKGDGAELVTIVSDDTQEITLRMPQPPMQPPEYVGKERDKGWYDMHNPNSRHWFLRHMNGE
jgi:hypothetical protein